jgi:hypothetical protein
MSCRCIPPFEQDTPSGTKPNKNGKCDSDHTEWTDGRCVTGYDSKISCLDNTGKKPVTIKTYDYHLNHDKSFCIRNNTPSSEDPLDVLTCSQK